MMLLPRFDPLYEIVYNAHKLVIYETIGRRGFESYASHMCNNLYPDYIHPCSVFCSPSFFVQDLF
jgi:hypothetical protein